MSSAYHLAAILFADIAGYTALMQEDEEQALVLIGRFKSCLESITPRHQGRIIQYFGDGCLLAFDSSVESLACALELQQAFRENPEVPVRIGLHLGEVRFHNENAFGDGVNIASRIQSLGVPGSILFSKIIRDQVRNKHGFSMEPLGPFDFKNVEEPIQLFALSNDGLVVPKPGTLTGKLKPKDSHSKKTVLKWIMAFTGLAIAALMAWLFLFRADGRALGHSPANSIAVLYFTNMSGDSTQEYFSDGMTDEIISRLSGINGLKVKSRTSVLPYKKQPVTVRQLATDLGITHILEGSVRKQGNQVRITAQLINAATDEEQWSNNYDRELSDIFAVQTEIAQQIAQQLRITLTPETRQRLAQTPTRSIEAYDKYLKAKSLTYLETGLGGKRTNTQQAILLLKEVLALDPAFAEAAALLSQGFSVYSRVAEYPASWLDSAKRYAQLAISLQPARAEGYIAMAQVMEQSGQQEESLNWLLKAHEQAPFSSAERIGLLYISKLDYAHAYEWVRKTKAYDPRETSNYILVEGNIFINLGWLDSTKRCIDEARKLKPESRETDEISIDYSLFTGNEKEHLRLLKKLYAADPKLFTYTTGRFYLFRRNWKKADSVYALSSRPDEMDAGLIKLYLGQSALGKKYLEQAISSRQSFVGRNRNDAWHNYDISRCYAALQDARFSFYLSMAMEKGWHDYTWFENDPFFDAVRETPAFTSLRKKMQERNEQFITGLKKQMQLHP